MKSLKHLNKYFYKYRYRLILGIFFITISNFFAILPAQIVRDAFDLVKQSLTNYHQLNTNAEKSVLYEQIISALLIFGLLTLAYALLKGIFMFFMRQTIIVMSRHIEYDLKNEVFEQYQKLNTSFYKMNSTGDLMNRISEDVSRVRMYIGPAIMYSINLIVLVVLVIIAMLKVNPTLTFYTLLPLPLLIVLIYFVSSVINKKSELVQGQLSDISTMAQETFSGIRIIKAFDRSSDYYKSFEAESEIYKKKSLDLVKTDAIFAPVITLLIGLSTLFTIYVGGKQAIAGQITLGNIAEFVIYINMITWPVASIGWVISIIQHAAASQKRINEFLHTMPEIINEKVEKESIKGDIEFKEVNFNYADSGVEALKNVSFKVDAGKSLAIIGSTGSGKSTIANLICRLYDTTSGTVMIDGRNIRNVHLNSLRESIGYVPQEVFLFSDTIANNIAFSTSLGADRMNKEKIENAAKDADVYSNIIEFPNGFETVVGERGITLSGGQKQRISIARAIIKSPQILIFDDCLSAVDTQTEERILRNLSVVMKNKTTLIISHRVSSVKMADEIIVMDHGRILEKGNHTQLLEKKSVYFEIYKKQLLEQERVMSN